MSETRAPYRLPPNPVRAATLLALAQAARHAVAAGNYAADPEPFMALAGEIERVVERVERLQGMEAGKKPVV